MTGSVRLSCEIHYFDAATTLHVLDAAAGEAALERLAETPLMLSTPEGVFAGIRFTAPSRVSVDVMQGATFLGSSAYTLSPSEPLATDLQLPMQPFVKDAITYDRVWVGCTSRVSAEPGGDRKESQARSIERFVDDLARGSAWHKPVDATALKTRERARIVEGDGSDAVFFGAAWRTLNAFPQGHQFLGSPDPNVCGKAIPHANTSRFGVCGRPSPAGLVVTRANPGNKLGLFPGDVITEAGDDRGDAIFEHAYDRPMCGATFPAASGRHAAGAASFFGSVPPGTKLTIQNRFGGQRVILVPEESDAEATDCTDLFGRKREVHAEAAFARGGVAVIRLPSFFPFDQTFPENPTEAQIDALIAGFQAEVQKVFDTVKDAPAIVWDARGNTGGFTRVALAIASGFPGAQAAPISYCEARIAGSSPPAFGGPRFAEYALTPGGPFAYGGKVAVLTDGLAYSAGDYFPYITMKATSAIVVGSATAGAFGGGQNPLSIAGPPALSAGFDVSACFDAATNTPLEGAPRPPTVAVSPDPTDLRTERDTVLERAVKELGF